MSINIQSDKLEVQVELEGKIYVEDAAILRENLLQLIDQGKTRFIFDMSKLNYIDSSGLGVLVAIHKRTIERGGGIVVKGLQGAVKELFSLTRLNRVFEII
ncbi:anti-sigma-factor antagonist [Desulfitobacterium dichloroeliminans LMG P-21439]|uniref:Anti-sigma factor antagonist n=1 Tax=Desulfitobacterium dichloroeliminans (strain LMG P-21439 / DCA1) TaxID=871963 RepID=L0FC27_DESDL|nr:STAS domain-containing protein [Desulfitobacterium dichloroeliminans]AGA70545.1 anti-sigma-factor antagonist [Desulfitobacterium dichloroeliminans LMG P-21439]